eukprot:13182154-Alexandrium_andersonii.AAC.1
MHPGPGAYDTGSPIADLQDGKLWEGISGKQQCVSTEDGRKVAPNTLTAPAFECMRERGSPPHHAATTREHAHKGQADGGWHELKQWS